MTVGYIDIPILGASTSSIEATSAALGATSANTPGTIVKRVFNPSFPASFPDPLGRNVFEVGAIWATSAQNRIDLVKQVLYNNDQAAVDWASRVLQDFQGVDSVLWDDKSLVDFDGNPTIGWASSLMFGAAGPPNFGGESLDWQNRFLLDDTRKNGGIDWNSKFLIATSGTITCDWDKRALFNFGTRQELSWGNQGIHLRQLSSSGASVSAVVGTGAGTGGSVSISGFGSVSGTIILTTGALPSAASTAVTVTLVPSTASFINGSKIIITPNNSNAAILSGNTSVYMVGSTGPNFTLVSGVVGLVGATEYRWYYMVMG